jgi:hypothetical protein
VEKSQPSELNARSKAQQVTNHTMEEKENGVKEERFRRQKKRVLHTQPNRRANPTKREATGTALAVVVLMVAGGSWERWSECCSAWNWGPKWTPAPEQR